MIDDLQSKLGLIMTQKLANFWQTIFFSNRKHLQQKKIFNFGFSIMNLFD